MGVAQEQPWPLRYTCSKWCDPSALSDTLPHPAHPQAVHVLLGHKLSLPLSSCLRAGTGLFASTSLSLFLDTTPFECTQGNHCWLMV